ncbi:MAG TPA: uroporphyrinogen-III C-methyltransferase [Nitrososphaeraceae archaeon]|nr:uroporphyrinogen-III C-methyltransferase [Nitrososphaeraceae archaeon]
MRKKGKVFICGAGPGDPKLVTVRAMEVLNNCDVVLYDRLICKELIDEIPAKTKKIYVGRAVGDSTIHQNITNELMVEHAKNGKRVVRLKGGDPFIFGRGAEEAEYLIDHNIEFEIIPGITSAIGSAAYAGIPLTHRRYASSVAIVTGHEDPKKREPNVKWDKLAKTVNTIVIFMGVEELEYISYKLIKAGMSKKLDVAVIENGTTMKQRVVKGNLSNIAQIARENGMKPPAIIIIGKVVSFQDKLAWFGK